MLLSHVDGGLTVTPGIRAHMCFGTRNMGHVYFRSSLSEPHSVGLSCLSHQHLLPTENRTFSLVLHRDQLA